jgi:pimeloyl-ACP methyl ester carboxylesterase
MANFVLVHGAWIGGWCWRPNAQALRRAGHEVFTPTLTGLGERSHLMNPTINLDTHITDIVNVIKYEELSDVVLVGHSYGGMVVTGVADKLPEKIASLVYLDAFVPENGQSLAELAPPEPKPQAASDYTLAPLPATVFGAKPEVAAFIDAHTSPHPTACFAQPAKLTGGSIVSTRKRTSTPMCRRRPLSRSSTRRPKLSRVGRCRPSPARTSSRSTCPMS